MKAVKPCPLTPLSEEASYILLNDPLEPAIRKSIPCDFQNSFNLSFKSVFAESSFLKGSLENSFPHSSPITNYSIPSSFKKSEGVTLVRNTFDFV